MKYPAGTRFLDYFYSVDDTRFTIRRQVVLPDGKRASPRHPRSAYSRFTTEEEIKAYVDRLNHQTDREAKKAIVLNSAFIPVGFLDEFRGRIESEIPNQKDAAHLFSLLQTRCLNIFIGQFKLPDPASWTENQTKWTNYLLKTGYSAKTLRHIIQISNRFLEFLHQKNPREIPFIKLKPISKARFKELQAKRQLEEDSQVGAYITDKDWMLIRESLPPDIRPFVILMSVRLKAL